MDIYCHLTTLLPHATLFCEDGNQVYGIPWLTSKYYHHGNRELAVKFK
uniref:Uncharacterized protein n=1 Tax=Anguilla anguilla TaxID=7936 RepID=A0A0E9PZC0_ANGAN